MIWAVAVVALAAVAATFSTGSPVLPTARNAVPTAKVVRGPLKLTVYATGELRAGRTVNLMAPPAGGMLRIVNREGLEGISCDCYRLVRGHYEQMLGASQNHSFTTR